MARLAWDTLGAVLAGQRGPVHWRYRLHRSDLAGTVGDRIFDVTGGEVSMSNFRDHTWELALTRRELEEPELALFGDWVRVFVEVRTGELHEAPGTRYRSFPFGLFQIDPPNPEHDEASTTYAVTGRSPEIVVLDDYATDGYKAAKGTGVLEESRRILTSRGVPPERIDFPAHDVKLTADLWVDQHQDWSKCSRLRIVNTLLNAGGFYALYTDAEGYFKTKEIEDTASRKHDAEWTSEGPFRMVVGSIGEEYDLSSFANKVVVYAGEPGSAMIDAVAVNADPESPGSVLPPPAGIGRVVMREPVKLQNVVSQNEADKLARAQLKRDTAANHKIRMSVLPDPRRGPREDVYLDVRRPHYPDPDAYGPLEGEPGERVLQGRFTIVGWTFPLENPPQPMSVELTRAEKLVNV